MEKLSRRSMLRRSSGLTAAAAALLPMANSSAQEKRAEPDRKLRVVAVGGHWDDPQTCAGGTLALYVDQGHDVVALTLTGGPPPAPDANTGSALSRSDWTLRRWPRFLRSGWNA